jgi:hypothetical protein
MGVFLMQGVGGLSPALDRFPSGRLYYYHESSPVSPFGEDQAALARPAALPFGAWRVIKPFLVYSRRQEQAPFFFIHHVRFTIH